VADQSDALRRIKESASDTFREENGMRWNAS